MTPEDKSKKITKLINKVNKNQYFDDRNNPAYSIFMDETQALKEANTICAFDMEFSNKTGNNIVEVGVAIYDRETNQTYSEHFIVEEEIDNYKRNNTPMEHKSMFAYGESKVVSLNTAMSALNTLMNNSDVNIVYAQKDKHKHMIEHNFKNDSFICIQDLMRIKSRNNQYTSLGLAIEFFDKEQPINNAGNDAASTLAILSNEFGNEVNLKNYEVPVVNDYSKDPRKQDSYDIRKSRARNNKLEKNLKEKSVVEGKKLKL